jgi:ribosomal protein S18 acetylase RimI-like enzyme
MILTIVRAANLADAEAIADVHVTSWRESYEGIVPKAILDTLSLSERTEKWQRILTQVGGQPVHVAEQGGRLVGFAQGGKKLSDELGQEMELYAIYLLSDAKRQGVGTRLLKAVVNDFIRLGANSAGLWVFKENYSARRFYEHFGAHPAAEKVDNRFGHQLVDVGYVWTDLKRSFSS